MVKLLGLSLMLSGLICPPLWSQVKPGPPMGIAFQTGTLTQVLQLAKARQQPVFIEVYMTGCPHCEALAPVLAEPPVGAFYNSRFINWQVEANSTESKRLQQQLKLRYPEFPILLFLSPQGQLWHLATPAELPTRRAFIEEVIRQGQVALDARQRASSYADRLAAGERGLTFLLTAGKYWQAVGDTLQGERLLDILSGQLATDADRQSDVGLFVLKRFVTDFDHPLAQYFFNHLAAYTRTFAPKDIQEAGEQILYQSLYGRRSRQRSADQIVRYRQAMIGLGITEQQARARTLIPEVEALLRSGQTGPAAGSIDRYCQTASSVSVGEYTYFIRLFNEQAADGAYLSSASGWKQRAEALLSRQPSAAQQAGLYYEWAVALNRGGQSDNAMAIARQGLTLARQAKLDVSKYQQFIRSLPVSSR